MNQEHDRYIDLTKTETAKHRWQTIYRSYRRHLPSKEFAGHQQLLTIEPGDEITSSAASVWGFHFSVRNLDIVKTNDNKLYFFPKMPTFNQMFDIVSWVSVGYGVDQRPWQMDAAAIKNLIETNKDVYCYELAPTEEDKGKLAIIKYNGAYGHGKPITGLEVTTQEEVHWQILDMISIKVRG